MSKGNANVEEILQAVIISDSYNSRFKPLTKDRPRCLMPLINVPLIEYTLEFLAASAVQEIFIFVCAHASQIKDYISKSAWHGAAAPRIEFISTPDSTSVGDAMRRLDEEQKIKSDFILLSGDVVSNIPGADIVKAHKARRERDKSSIMTMVFRETGPLHRARSIAESSVVVLAGEHHRCLHYDQALQSRSSKLVLDTSILKGQDDIQIRNDLLDCNIDICSPEVPALFSENFDYNDMRRDFVHGILTSDLLGKTIHSHIEDSKYAARIQDLRSYDAVSRDLIARWAFPIVPENLATSDLTFTHETQNIYKGDGVRLARSALLASHVALGPRVKVGDHSQIACSALGADCTVGSGCEVSGSYLWSNVTVGHSCRINQALISDNVMIGDDCIIHPGAVIGPGVCLASGTVVHPDTKIATHGDAEIEVVGPGGHGRRYVDSHDGSGSDSGNDDDSSQSSLAETAGALSSFRYRQAFLARSDDSISSLGSVQDEEKNVRRPSFAASAQSDEDSALVFYDLARADLETAFKENHHVDDVMLEMTSLRMREDVGMHEVRIAMLSAILSKAHAAQPDKVNLSIKHLVTRWSELLLRTISENTRKEDCLDMLLSLQQICMPVQMSTLFVPTLKFMYDCEVIQEDSIMAWFHNSKSSIDEAARDIRGKATGFVTWLQNAEEATSDESD